MPEPSVMMFDEGFDRGIRCRFINKWCRIDYYVSSKEEMLSEIKKNNPDAVVMDLDLYAQIDGIETSRKIRFQFGILVIYA